MLVDSVFSFSYLDSAWPNDNNSPILIQRQKKSLSLFFSTIICAVILTIVAEVSS